MTMRIMRRKKMCVDEEREDKIDELIEWEVDEDFLEEEADEEDEEDRVH
jgi:hypothetical protein